MARTMIKGGLALSGLAAAALLAAACSSPATSTAGRGNGHVAAAKSVISVRQLRGIGAALVNSSGMTIYTPKKPAEVNGMIKCTGSCTGFWVPVTPSSAHPAANGLPGKLGTLHRPGGGTQLTYNGRPLYTFRLDNAPGQARGNDFHDSFNGTNFTWQVVTASGEPVGTGLPPPSPSYNSHTRY